MTSARVFATTLAIAAAVSACSDPKAASKENFKKAIQAQIDAEHGRPACAELVFYSGKVSDDGAVTVAGNTYAKDSLAAADALVEAGLMTRADDEVEQVGAGSLRPAKVPAFRYQVTEEGKKYRTAPERTPFSRSRGMHFCTGRTSIKDVTLFTEPTDALGHKVSNVTYTAVLTDAAAWALKPEVQKAFPRLARELAAEPVEKKATVVLTSEGWVDGKRL